MQIDAQSDWWAEEEKESPDLVKVTSVRFDKPTSQVVFDPNFFDILDIKEDERRATVQNNLRTTLPEAKAFKSKKSLVTSVTISRDEEVKSRGGSLLTGANVGCLHYSEGDPVRVSSALPLKSKRELEEEIS